MNCSSLLLEDWQSKIISEVLTVEFAISRLFAATNLFQVWHGAVCEGMLIVVLRGFEQLEEMAENC